MDTDKAAALMAIVEHGSITAAARVLGYTASGVSRMVEAIEADLGFALFTRSRSCLAVTSEGRRVLPAFEEFARWGGRIEEVAAEVRGSVVGELTVGAYFCLAETWLPAILWEFSRRYPGVRVDVAEGGNSELSGDLAHGHADVSLVSRHDAIGDFIHLYTDQYVVWVPRGHELAGEGAIPVARLAGLPFVMPLPGTDNDVERFLAANGIEVDVRFSSRSAGALWAMVEAGLGVSMNNALMSTHLTGDVVEVPLDPPYLIDLGVAVPSLADASPAARRFVAVAREVVGGMSAAGGERGAGR